MALAPLVFADVEDDLDDKDLDTLERHIRIQQMAAATHDMRSIEAAMEIGRALEAAQRHLKWGELIAWAEDRFSYKKSHTKNLLRLHKERANVVGLLEQDPSLTIRGAIAALSDKLKEAKEPAPPRTPLEIPATLPWHVDIRELDAADPPAEWHSTIDLVVTSWPYGVDEQRCGYVDVPSFAEWLVRARSWADALVRVLKPNGRVALVLPVSVRKGGPRPLASFGNRILMEAGLSYETTIEWPKGQGGQTANSVPRGSLDSPNALTIATGAEQVLVYHRGGEWNLGRPGEPSDLSHDEWLAWTNGLWTFPGATDPDGYPCIFPDDMAERLIKLLSFPGDTTGDLHAGSGTVAGVAVSLGRHFKGGDINPEAVKRSQTRVAAAGVRKEVR